MPDEKNYDRAMKILGISSLILILCPYLWAFDDAPLWRLALGGKIDSFPAQGPNGDIYAIADDRGLHAIDPSNGKHLWTYRPGGRLLNVLLVSPDNTIYIQNDRQELFAVTPGGTGRWKLRMQTNAASLPTIGPGARLIIPLVGGQIVCITRHGNIAWTVNEKSDASSAPVADMNGNFWIPLTDGRIIGLNAVGNTIAVLQGMGPAAMIVPDFSGSLWAGGFSGELAVYDLPTVIYQSKTLDTIPVVYPRFKLSGNGYRVNAIHIDEDHSGYVFFINGTVMAIDKNGTEIFRKKHAASQGYPSLASDGTLFIPVSSGGIHVVEENGQTAELGTETVLAEPLLTMDGKIIAGGGNWILYCWAAAPANPGWFQFRANPMRSGALPFKQTEQNRLEAEKEPGFIIREKMAKSEDTEERSALLDELESFSNEFEMYKNLPWVNLLLRELASMDTLGSHSLIRARVYTLWGKSEDYRMVYELRHLLANEDDLTALTTGIRALGQQGTDWDGASMRFITKTYDNQFPEDPQLALATAEALANLIRYNGKISDPVGHGLFVKLLQFSDRSPYGKEILEKLRDLSGL